MKKKLIMAIAIAVLLVFSVATVQEAGAQEKAKKEKKEKAPKAPKAPKGGAAAAGGELSVDLSTATALNWWHATKKLDTSAPVSGSRNPKPFTKQWDGVVIQFPGLTFDLSAYKRATIKAKYFDAEGVEINQGDSNAMVVLFYDVNGDLEGPEMGAGPNTPLKEFNVGGFSGLVSKDKGSRIILTKVPGGVLLQCANGGVKFIELTEVTFQNR